MGDAADCLFLPCLLFAGWVLWAIIFGSCIIPGVILLDQAEECLNDSGCDADSVEYESNTGTALLAIGLVPAVVIGCPYLCITFGVAYKMFCVGAGCDT